MPICTGLVNSGPIGWFVLFLLFPILLPLDAVLSITNLEG